MAERLHWGSVGSAVPIRTCVGCRQRDKQSDLLRVVVAGSDLSPDDLTRQPGRGAYLHPRSECLAKAKRRRAWSRALRIAGPLSDEVLAQRVRQQEMTVQGSGD